MHRDANDKFITVSGAGVSYTNWNPNEPNNSGGIEDCVQLLTCWGDGMIYHALFQVYTMSVNSIASHKAN